MPKIPKLTTPRKSQRAGDLAGASIRTPRRTITTSTTQKLNDLEIHCSVPRCPATFQLESARAKHIYITHSGTSSVKHVFKEPVQCNVRPCPAVFWSDAEKVAHTKIPHVWHACPRLSLQGAERICWRQFLALGDMHKHLWEGHGDAEFAFECGRCRKDYVSRLGSVCQACEEDG